MNQDNRISKFSNAVQELNEVQLSKIIGGDLIVEDYDGNPICPCPVWVFFEIL